MRNWTWAEIQTKVRRDLDLQEEDFIDDDELLGYLNEAIDEAEANIHNLWEDYFLDDDSINLIEGQADYDLPGDIYAQKIRHLQYDNGGTNYYKIEEVDLHRIAELTASQASVDRFYFKLVNDLTDGMKLRFYPTPTASETGTVKIWYLRNAKQITATTDVIDIPEFINFIMQHMKVRCYEKDLGNPNRMKAMQDLERERMIMIQTLSERTPDLVKPLEIDMSYYEEHS